MRMFEKTTLVKDFVSNLQRRSALTEAEEKILEGIFKGKLPTAEKELTEGIVTRAKV